jgi:hypothetical protein
MTDLCASCEHTIGYHDPSGGCNWSQRVENGSIVCYCSSFDGEE